MNWTTPDDLAGILGRKWQRGLLLRAYLENDSLFPIRVAIKHPSSKELGSLFSEAREWLQQLEALAKPNSGKGYELEYREMNHQQLGRQKIPVAAIFMEEKDALEVIGKSREAKKFRQLTGEIMASWPTLLPWLKKRPLEVLEQSKEWPRLLAILAFIKDTPRPGIYLRQLDIAGVDTKFIENHKKLISELLDLILPPEAINLQAKGAAVFAERYGFTAKPIQVRFRILDANLYIQGLSDLQIPVDEFGRLNLEVEQVFITENMINGLAFPDFPRAIVIFGLGYGLDRLAAITWLKNKKISYWGDLDSHGFAMLDQIRSYFPQTTSLLMDRATLLFHKKQWGFETSPTTKELPRLDKEEDQLYNEIRENHLADGLRLEQERISYKLLRSALDQL